ncbi:MAG TPA: sigma factor-like helix-turn-helix DNA-binding protein [Steroidobacteraceae bacterium]|nr:sigma factor-like helix-turn-helix DNA-binding protein [Steroidobacteraceae bacterium]
MLDPVTEERARASAASAAHGLPDLLLIERARGADAPALEALTRRYAQRLYRLARGTLGDEAAAESAVQQAYAAAFEELRRHEPAGKFAVWLTRLALEQLRLRRAAAPGAARSPPVCRHPLEPAIDALPEAFRTVLVLRVVEGMSGTETAAVLGLNLTTVRTRLYRANRRLSGGAALHAAPAVFALEGVRLERIVAEVLARQHTRGA